MPLLVTYVLTAGCAVVVAVTRRMLRGLVPVRLLAVHTALGALGTVLWLAFLIIPSDQALIGVLGLGCWWVVSVAGLVLLTRWLPRRSSRGKRAGSQATAGTPWLSVIAHLGVFVAAIWFTWAYVTGRV